MNNNLEAVLQIRQFNRFYTNIIGVLDQHILKSPHSLAEARIIYELSQSENCTARHIKENLQMDEGYLSRIIKKFVQQGLVKKTKSEQDARNYYLSLTEKGKAQFMQLNQESQESIGQMIAPLSVAELEELLAMMNKIETILSKSI